MFIRDFITNIYFKLLGEVEEHLGCTITQVDQEINVPVDEFDGKVTYGSKRAATNTGDAF